MAHPNWRMGAKISVDSATMMNKGLEVIEAHHLFALPSDRLDVVVHPQSVVHGLVYYTDGSVLAQLGSPDMRTPIANALGWPERIGAPSPRLDLAKLAQLTFEAPDPKRFPALRLARAALERGRRRADRAQRRERDRGRRLPRRAASASSTSSAWSSARSRHLPDAASRASTTSMPSMARRAPPRAASSATDCGVRA